MPLLGAVFYSGVVAAGVEQRRSGVRHGIADVARSLPYRALIVADIALVLRHGLGFLAPDRPRLHLHHLVRPYRPGDRGRGARRPRRVPPQPRPRPPALLARGAAIVIPLIFLQAALESGGEQLGHSLLGEGYLGNWLASVGLQPARLPLYALTVLALYFEIRARERTPARR